VAATPDSERLEAMEDLLASLLLVAVGLLAMLLVTAWNVRRAFRPLHDLLACIRRLEHGEPGAIASLPAMPIQELQVVAAALQRLDEALVAAERERRMLAQKVLTLQEDERQLLAQELHDEFGQRLTALRVDAAWLRRRVEGDAQLAGVVDGMADQCQHIQQDVRSLLTRLRPLGPASAPAREPVGRISGLLGELVRAWSRRDDGVGPCITLQLQAVGADGTPGPWPAQNAPPSMPRELLLAIYRISQEALTNVARHAGAGHAAMELAFRQDGGVATLDWCVRDDGAGIGCMGDALLRGNGLAGMRERAWALGADLRISVACDDARRPGLMLRARFAFELEGAARNEGHRETA
jgi:two-component system sensor histidine kinase UhpB